MSATEVALHRRCSSAARVRAAAKLNLTLRVLGLRADGYHDLESLVVGADLCDSLELEPGKNGGIDLTCNQAALSRPENLVIQAARRLAQHLGRQPRLRINLQKRIPVGAGLGGGSADAAAALRGCNHLWSAGLGDNELAELGASLGSDVPLFFSLPCCVIEGRGERVSRHTMKWSGLALVLFPGFPMATAEVYSAWRPTDAEGRRSTVESALRADSAEALSECLFNDLEPAAFRVCPLLAGLVEDLRAWGAGSFRMTGSGSALYRLFDDADAALAAAGRVHDRAPWMTRFVVAAPVGSAQPLCEDS